jgi:hypothetical protein
MMHGQQNIKLVPMFGSKLLQTKEAGFYEMTPVFYTTQQLTLTKEDHNLRICHNEHLKNELANGHLKQTTHLTILSSSNYVLSVWRVGKARDVVEVALLFHDVRLTLPLPYQQLSQANAAQGHPVSSAV